MSVQTRDERLRDVLETPRDNDMKGTQTTRLQVNKETVGLLKIKNSQTRDATTTEDMFHLKGTSQQ
jgi:hypothetical protein